MKDVTVLNSVRKMPLMELRVSSLLLRLRDGSGILISPGSKMTREQLQSFSNVTDIIAPNLLHCEGSQLASEIFRDARVWGPPA